MAEVLGWGILPAFFIGLAASWAIEGLLRPRPVMAWRRPFRANLTHVGVVLIGFSLELALFRRPYFAMANVLALELVVVLVSRAKDHALQEPFVFPDFEYFTDAIRHPRLYLPFFGWGNALATAAGFGGALWVGLSVEPEIATQAGPLFFPGIALTVAAGTALAAWAAKGLKVEFDAASDLRRLGIFSALWAYGRAERQCTVTARAAAPFQSRRPSRLPSSLPDLVSVQSESFFDVRRSYPLVKNEVLAGFDALRQESLLWGELDVAARGANTVRTEFAFLSGMDVDALGVHRYNPYRRFAGEGVPTVASYLKSLGYRTICVHPFHGSFYRRDKVLPKLGFDEFFDLKAFEGVEKAGAYVSDRALGEFVSSLLKRNGQQPLYIHVITMENHGPLHWEPVTDEDAEEFLSGPLPKGCEDLVAYARHLRNADAMFSDLRRTLLTNGRPAGLCIYGDHVPIMPKVYGSLGAVSGTTDMVIWTTGEQSADGETGPHGITRLARDFLSRLGLI